jgi:hypothetical protein
MRRWSDICHSTDDGRFGGEHLGQADFVITAQMEIGCSQ